MPDDLQQVKAKIPKETLSAAVGWLATLEAEDSKWNVATLEEVAERLDTSLATVKRWRREEHLPGQPGRWNMQAIMQWLIRDKKPETSYEKRWSQVFPIVHAVETVVMGAALDGGTDEFETSIPAEVPEVVKVAIRKEAGKLLGAVLEQIRREATERNQKQPDERAEQ